MLRRQQLKWWKCRKTGAMGHYYITNFFFFARRFSCSFFFFGWSSEETCVSLFSTEFIKYFIAYDAREKKNNTWKTEGENGWKSFSDAIFIAQHLRSKYEKVEQQWFQLLLYLKCYRRHTLEWQTFQILNVTPMNGIKILSSRVRIYYV